MIWTRVFQVPKLKVQPTNVCHESTTLDFLSTLSNGRQASFLESLGEFLSSLKTVPFRCTCTGSWPRGKIWLRPCTAALNHARYNRTFGSGRKPLSSKIFIGKYCVQATVWNCHILNHFVELHSLTNSGTRYHKTPFSDRVGLDESILSSSPQH